MLNGRIKVFLDPVLSRWGICSPDVRKIIDEFAEYNFSGKEEIESLRLLPLFGAQDNSSGEKKFFIGIWRLGIRPDKGRVDLFYFHPGNKNFHQGCVHKRMMSENDELFSILPREAQEILAG